MGVIIGIDPGKRHTAAVVVACRTQAAVCSKSRPFAIATYMTERVKNADLSEVIIYQLGRVKTFVQEVANGMVIEAIVIESPKIYPNAPQRDSDIMDLQRVAGALEGSLFGIAKQIVPVAPATWKQQVPKHIHNRRLLEQAPEMNRFLENVPISKQEHLIDAYGIGAWYAKKLYGAKS